MKVGVHDSYKCVHETDHDRERVILDVDIRKSERARVYVYVCVSE